MEVFFYLMDLAYHFEEDSLFILLFGKTLSKERIIVKEEFFPYFYIEPTDFGEDFKKEILSLKEKGRIEAKVIKVEETRKRFFGQDLSLLKVYLNHPQAVFRIRDLLSSHPKVKNTYEFDLPFLHRYLIDKQIIPFHLLRAEGEFTKEKSKTPVFQAEKVSLFGEESLDRFNILAFDLETYNREGKAVNPEKNPIIMLSLYGKEIRKVITWKRFPSPFAFMEFVSNEEALIRRFKELVEKEKPDLLVGYFSDGFDLPYLKIRAGIYGINLDLGFNFSSLRISQKGLLTSHFQGLIHLDLFRFIRYHFGQILESDSLFLGEVAEELLGEKKKEVDLNSLYLHWDAASERLNEFADYNLTNATLIYQLSEKVLPQMVELTKLTGLPLFEVARASSSTLVEFYLERAIKRYNQLIPEKPSYYLINQRKKLSYQGGFVYQPKPGLYHHLVVFDFRSLYPSIIISHNISPYTFQCPCCQGKTKVPGLDSWFCLEQDGIISSLVEELVSRRLSIKEILKKEPENISLKARAENLKILANAFYGYLAFPLARWYSIESAKAVAAYGRFYIKKVIEECQKSFEVVYTDTDSVFLCLGKRSKEEAEGFVNEINKKLPSFMELNYQGFYPSALFVQSRSGVGAKKKYVLLDENNQIRIKGFEFVRRNYASIAKETQERILEILLKENNLSKAIEYLKEIINDLKSGNFPLEKLIIRTQIQKDLRRYESLGPHVAVAQRLVEKGQPVRSGSVIKFIITKGEGMIRTRAKPPEEVKENEFDANYYINHQIIPSLAGIFSVFGVIIEEEIRPKEQESLKKFF